MCSLMLVVKYLFFLKTWIDFWLFFFTSEKIKVPFFKNFSDDFSILAPYPFPLNFFSTIIDTNPDDLFKSYLTVAIGENLLKYANS